MKKKDILIFMGSLKFGGAERVASRLANSLVKEGYPVHLVIYKNVINFKLDERIKVVCFDIEHLNSNVLKLVAVYFKLLFYLLKTRPWRAIALTRFSSVVLGMTLYPGVTGRFDSYPMYLSWKKRLSMLIAFNLPTVKNIISPSSELAKDVKPYFVRKSKISVIPNPIERGLVTESANASKPPTDRKYLVSLGRLNRSKDPWLTIKAYQHSEIRKKYDLVFIGDGPILDDLVQYCQKDAELSNKVHFTGFMKYPFSLLQQAEFFVSASRWEGFPNVHIEALALGVPVISADCKTGPSEIITDGYNGFLFPVADEKKLTSLFDLLAKDAKLLATLRGNAVASVEHLRSDKIIKRWQDIILC